MAQTARNPKQQTLVSQVPEITPAAIHYFQKRLPSFNYLDTRLRAKDNELAEFILARAEQLAPGLENMHDREQIAQLALEVYGLLLYQAEANYLVEIFGMGAVPGMAKAATSDGGASSQPPVA